MLAPTAVCLEGVRPHALHVDCYEPPRAEARPPYALLLVHGTAGHGGCYAGFARAAAALGPNVYALDLEGHGRSGGARGTFTMEGFLADVDAAAGLARARSQGAPVFLLGASQGGEVAFHALARSDAVAGAACMNVLLPAERPLNRKIAFMRGPLAAALARVFGDRLRVPLARVIDFAAAYAGDPDLLAEKRRDPLYVWSYGFASYRSIFAYDPPAPAAANRKPVLIACGERDPIVPPAHCRACFERIGGPASFVCMPGAGHQLMHCRREAFAPIVHSWALHHVERRPGPWTPPPEPEAEAYEAFLHEQSRADAAPLGEPEYALGPLDRLLCAIHNGRIASGVRFFAERRTTAYGRFVSDVVAQIDLAAWEEFARHLPPLPPQCRPRMAVLGCGNGRAIEWLLRAFPVLERWDIVGVDIDGDAIAEARARFLGHPRVRFRAADLRDPAALEPGSFDVVYKHGVLDHCAGHRSIARACARALRPGGKLFYIVPDRNIATWLGFVSVGPRFVFALTGEHAGVHDYRRFPRPPEMDALLRAAGLEPAVDRDGRTPLHRGVEYRSGPLGIWLGVRRRDLRALELELTPPRRWLAGGFRGEYLGVAVRPIEPEEATCAPMS